MKGTKDELNTEQLTLHLAEWKLASSTEQTVVLALEYRDRVGQRVELPLGLLPTDDAERFANDILRVCAETRVRTAKARGAH